MTIFFSGIVFFRVFNFYDLNLGIEEDEDDDDEGWITPGNLKAKRLEMLGANGVAEDEDKEIVRYLEAFFKVRKDFFLVISSTEHKQIPTWMVPYISREQLLYLNRNCFSFLFLKLPKLCFPGFFLSFWLCDNFPKTYQTFSNDCDEKRKITYYKSLQDHFFPSPPVLI